MTDECLPLDVVMTAEEEARREAEHNARCDTIIQGWIARALTEWGGAVRRFRWRGPPCPHGLECGSGCIEPMGHAGPCMCVGDDDGPGSCPA